MKRLTLLLLLASASPALSGCLPMMAVSAANIGAQAMQKQPASNQSLQPQAREACTEQAAQYGSVQVSFVEQHRVDQIIVWGTVDDGKQARSFECDFTTKVTGFTLHNIERVP